MIKENPYFFENKTYDKENSCYVPDKQNIWVSGIYKKTLVSLGVKVLGSELGGCIGHFATTDWCFLIAIEDKEKIKAAFAEAVE